MADDIDLDLDLEPAPEPPKRSKKPAKPEADASPEEPAADAPAVAPGERVGLLQKLLAPIMRLLDKISLPAWNVRTFLVGLIVLGLVILFVENGPPMRLSFFGLHADIPKAVVLAFDFLLGFTVAYMVLRRSAKSPLAEE